MEGIWDSHLDLWKRLETMWWKLENSWEELVELKDERGERLERVLNDREKKLKW